MVQSPSNSNFVRKTTNTEQDSKLANSDSNEKFQQNILLKNLKILNFLNRIRTPKF